MHDDEDVQGKPVWQDRGEQNLGRVERSRDAGACERLPGVQQRIPERRTSREPFVADEPVEGGKGVGRVAKREDAIADERLAKQPGDDRDEHAAYDHGTAASTRWADHQAPHGASVIRSSRSTRPNAIHPPATISPIVSTGS